ncbi:maternal tudor isoform X1 [Brachionus plicatilis]|uniref:Maternal tudor isoform X1 n=1 Tax=Brachionus plicatilis TaxID=10195 RepID=A0A3M7QZC2_BRAPC|nr:maternal tudor isoform X1 [Brachionus plicatilis]
MTRLLCTQLSQMLVFVCPIASTTSFFDFIWYELKLNKSSYLKKYNSACIHSDFVDAELIDQNLDHFKNKKFSLDLSQAFSHAELTNQAELISAENGKNLIDLVIEQSFKNINYHRFLCLISHINSIEDFYIQKLSMDTLLKELQETVQIKVQTNKLQPIRSTDNNKLCVAAFEDGCFYRAKIIASHSANAIEVFYIDYGNTATVRAGDLREITPDLVDRFPKNFAINCRLDLEYVPNNEELELINSFFLDILDEGRFDVKVKTRLTDNRYNDSGFYLIEMFDAQTKQNVIELFKKKIATEIHQASCVQMEASVSDSLEDDKAIAESLNDDTTINATNSESMYVERNFVPREDGWETTNLSIKNYDAYEETLSKTMMESGLDEDSNEKSELYSTANSSQLEKTLGEEETLKDCFISFLHSSEDFFVQKSDFDSEIEKIQPVIDQCLEPFDLNESQMCIGQFRQDGMFYRCKILQWMAEKREAFCELVDFGNRDYIDFDTITRMSDSLSSVKPLAINCSLGFGIQADSQAYANLNDLVNSDTKFDCKFKSDCVNGPALVELSIAKNNLVISKELLEDPNCMTMVNEVAKKSVFDEYYDINSSCKINGVKTKRQVDDDDDEDDQKIAANKLMTSTQVNMVQGTETQGQSNTNQDAPSDVAFFVAESLHQSVDHPKNETVNDVDESSWSRNNSVIDNTSMHPKNETVNDVDESSWSRNNSVIDNTSMHPKNETVNDVDESSWSRNNSVIDNTSMHPKNETVNDVDESSWSRNNSVVDTSSMHPKNETVNDVDESSWSRNNSVVDTSSMHPKNETVNDVDESSWSRNNSVIDNTSMHPKNETVNDVDESSWSRNNSVIDNTSMHPKNETVNDVDESSWSRNNSVIDNTSMHPKNETVNDVDESSWSRNNSAIDRTAMYLKKEESMWMEDPDQSGFVYKHHMNKVRSNLDTTTSEECAEYTQILNGYIIHVNSMDDFYFQAENADLKLMNMRHVIDKCVKKFDKPVKVGDLCISRYHVDDQMYRAQVIDVKSSALNLNQSINSTLKLPDQTVRIRYIDYGNEGYVNASQLFKCEPELKQVEPLALKCKLNVNKKLSNLIHRLNELRKDASDIVQYFKVVTGRSKVTVKVLRQVDFDLKSSPVDLFINNENICEVLVSEALACLSIQSEPTQPLQIKINTPKPEFSAHVLNVGNEFTKSVKLKNLNILQKIDDFVESLLEQTMAPLELDTATQCLAQVKANVVSSFKLTQPYVRVILADRNKHDLFECSFVDLDHKAMLTKHDLFPSSHFINRIQAACEKYDLQLNNGDCVFLLSADQKIQLQSIFKDLIDYEMNSSASLKIILDSIYQFNISFSLKPNRIDLVLTADCYNIFIFKKHSTHLIVFFYFTKLELIS